MKWITARNLEEWSSSINARTIFPALVADLVRASASNINAFRFPHGDKGQVRGFDGFLEADGVPPFVPDRASIWELKTSGDLVQAADDDFEKRTREVDPDVRKKTTFVFASPRTWDYPRKQIPAWLSEKRNLRQWGDVQCFDGVAIEHWLEMQPAVAAKYARYELGLMPQTGACSADEFWDEFSTRYSPALAKEVLLAGRKDQAEELLARLGEGESKLAYAADSADEVVAFVIAAIRNAPPEVRAFLEARVMVVDTIEAARQLSVKKGLIFLPRGQARQRTGLLAEAGPTIVSAGADEPRAQHRVLARPSSSELAKALTSMGYTESEGYERARRCGRSLSVLARQIPSGTAESPEWLTESESLLPALFAGAWTAAFPADIDVLTRIGGKSTYAEIEAPLRRLTKLKDPPIDRVGDVWAMRSSVDAFVYLGHCIGTEHLSRFAEQVRTVFSKVIEPPKANEVFKADSTKHELHSRWLRDGIMTTLLHIAVLHEEAGLQIPGLSPQQYVEEIVRSLPNLATDHRLLASLKDQLPLLAEAAPIPFFEALERLLEGDAEKIKPIFAEQDSFFAPGSAHVELLWALELLAWNENYLLRAARCLAKLAAIDPGGKLSNRPINSLRAIFLSWAPHTNAPSQKRIGVLSAVVKAEPGIAWSLLVKLLPQPYDSVTPTYKPKFAEASPGGQEKLTYAVVWAVQTAIVELAVQHAKDEPTRWQALIHTLSQLQPNSFDHVVHELDACLERLDADARFSTWDTLRKEVNRHHCFNDADWVMRGNPLQRLDALVAKFQPDDPLLVTIWLFDDWMPDVQEKNVDADPTAAIENARLEAVQSIRSTQGIQGIAELAFRVKLPYQMAESLHRLKLKLEEYSELLTRLLAMQHEAKALAKVVVRLGLKDFGDAWVERLRCLQFVSVEDMAWLFLALEDTKESWDIVASFGTEIEDEYWRRKGAFGFRGTPEELMYAISRYQALGRSLAAIEATQQQPSIVASSVLLSLLQNAIPEINAIVGSSNIGILEHYIKCLFKELEGRNDVSQEAFARLEFLYLPLFFHTRRKPSTLHKMLLESPEFFVSAISAVFKPASGEAPRASEQEQKLAVAAYELLNSLESLPGQAGNIVDFEMLQRWCDEVRKRAAQVDRSAITDYRIGHLLAHAPADPHDQAWPHLSVRRLIEYLSLPEIEQAICNERFNMRGVVGRAASEGGQQERDLAEQAKAWASVTPAFPRTSDMLVALAKMWVMHGKSVDERAAQDALHQ